MPKRGFTLAVAGLLTFLLLFAGRVKAQTPAVQLADSPWPMYQHDPQHTGRSPLLGPVNQPILLWSVPLPASTAGGFSGISIAGNGSLLISTGGALVNFDPAAQRVLWTYHGPLSWSTPLSASDGSVYWGYINDFVNLSKKGEVVWLAELGTNLVFNSSPTFDPYGNLYVVHDGLWSFTPGGFFRGYYPYYKSGIASHASPAIGLDGKIYAGGQVGDLCAYVSDLTIHWCGDIPLHNALDRNSAVGPDGTIYHPTDNGALAAVNPSGSLKWVFDPDPENEYLVPEGIAITHDHSIYFALELLSADKDNYIFAVDSNGQLKWKHPIPPNRLTGKHPIIRHPITVDRAGNAFLCPENSRCYGIGPDGKLLWEFEFPLVDSIILHGGQPVIAADGLFYVVDNQSRLYAYADPALYPVLTAPTGPIQVDAAWGSGSFTTTVPVSSTTAPITFTTSISPTASWLSVSPTEGTTPAPLTLIFEPSAMAAVNECTTLNLMTTSPVGLSIQIPVCLHTHMQHQVYLPLAMHQPFRILYGSSWFTEAQLVTIEPNGKNRQVITNSYTQHVFSQVYAPDKRKIAAVHYSDGGYQITAIDIATGASLLEIKTNTPDLHHPTWSPESDRIAFVSSRDDPVNGEVYVIHLNGNGLTRLTHNSFHEVSLFWSPGGEKIAVEYRNAPVALMNPDGSGVQPLATGNVKDSLLGWSPDGRFLLLQSTPQGNLAPQQMGKYDVQTGSYTYLTDRYYSGAAWSPDGTQIAFMGWETNPYDWDILSINADGSGLRSLTQFMGRDDFQPAWSPDSRWIAFTSKRRDIDSDPNLDIYVIRANGTGLLQLTTNILGDAYPFWLDWR